MSEVPTRLLRDALRDHAAASPSSACVDAETLAAWADGVLSARERDAIESHAAGCARCQAMLAAMAKTAPAPARAWWRTPALGWIVPLTAAASAVLWFGTMEIRHTPAQSKAIATARQVSQESQASLDRRSDAPQASPATAPAGAPPTPSSAPRPAARAVAPKTMAPAIASQPVPAQPAAAETAAVGQASKPAADRAERRDAAAAREAAAAPPSTPTAVAAADASTEPPARPPSPAFAAGANAAPAPTAESARLRAAAPMMMKSIAPQPLVIPAPGATTRWRLLPGGGVERSTDGGATWQEQSTGLAVTLTGGAATSSTTCWLVGPGGIVLLTTDGRTWQRVSLPEAIDVIGVRPTDEKSATVVAAGGRTFTTTDGGKTWK
jgi:hypothetical protein